MDARPQDGCLTERDGGNVWGVWIVWNVWIVWIVWRRLTPLSWTQALCASDEESDRAYIM
ncbi:hypothetical protein [Paenibacillus konkukensis]|uniref:hypothetical protein n=1 Tax=Paenibacillus konkukensis TaxID=2020716 RepID=UPI00201D77E9|nr:hypothetical protein [Paenibacillus konkukensis]